MTTAMTSMLLLSYPCGLVAPAARMDGLNFSNMPLPGCSPISSHCAPGGVQAGPGPIAFAINPAGTISDATPTQAVRFTLSSAVRTRIITFDARAREQARAGYSAFSINRREHRRNYNDASACFTVSCALRRCHHYLQHPGWRAQGPARGIRRQINPGNAIAGRYVDAAVWLTVSCAFRTAPSLR